MGFVGFGFGSFGFGFGFVSRVFEVFRFSRGCNFWPPALGFPLLRTPGGFLFIFWPFLFRLFGDLVFVFSLFFEGNLRVCLFAF